MFAKLVPATWALALANVAVFVVMAVKCGVGAMLVPTTEELLDMGASYGPCIMVLHQYWRLITSAFVHAGIVHLAINLYALVAIGTILEPRLGMVRYLLVYFASALGGAVVSLLVNPFNTSVGASGAVFGILGCVLVLRVREGGIGDNRRFMIFVGVLAVSYSLFFGAITPGVDNASHVGGLITGVALAFALAPLMVPLRPVGAADAVLALVVLALVTGAVALDTVSTASNPKLIAAGFAEEAMTYLRRKRTADAARVADSALALGMSDSAFYVAKGADYADRKLFADAIAACDKALELDKKCRAALATRAIAHHHLGDDLGAVGDNSAVIALDANKPLPYNNRAWSYCALGEYEKAVADARKAIELSPREANLYDTLGVALAYLHRFAEARQALDKAITLDAAEGAYYYHRARVLRAMALAAEADADDQQVRAHPYEPDAWERKRPL